MDDLVKGFVMGVITGFILGSFVLLLILIDIY